MLALLGRLLAIVVPIIVILVGAAFVLPPTFPWLPRQLLLAAVGIGGIAVGETFLFRSPSRDLARRLGFAAPNWRVVVGCLAAGLPMWLFLPLVAMIIGTPVHMAQDWLAIIGGVILLNGLAEEAIHRAFFFGRLRQRTGFLASAALGAALFGAQHLYLIATLGLAGGAASVVLALLLAFPLCRAFELGDRSIVGPAILHTSSNAAFLVFGDPSNVGLLMLHMLVVLVSIYAVFLIRKPIVLATAEAAAPASL